MKRNDIKESEVKFELREPEAKAFFLFTCFGILSEPTEEYKETRYSAIAKCAYRAYLDMCRTLSVKHDDQSFAKKYCLKIAEEICELFSVDAMKAKAYSIFFDECDNLRSNELEEYLSKKEKNIRHDAVFYYGHAQKWINMTLKYMWMIGLIDNAEADKLDVPVDRFILKAIKNKTEKNSFSGLPWSELNKGEYQKIKDKINGVKSTIQHPILWECKTWINYAANEARNDKKKNWLWPKEPNKKTNE